MSYYVCKRGEVIPACTREKISRRYHTITMAINKELWNSTSDVNHSLYVGSYGRGTAINTSDVDIIVELPEDEYTSPNQSFIQGATDFLQAVYDQLHDSVKCKKVYFLYPSLEEDMYVLRNAQTRAREFVVAPELRNIIKYKVKIV